MKLSVYSDLHLSNRTLLDIKKYISLTNNDSEVIAICGDVYEQGLIFNAMKRELNLLDILADIFPNKEVVFCLGNHEFAHNDYNKVLDFFKTLKHEKVHCLDIDGKFDYKDCNFVGNVFWYDYTLGPNNQILYGKISQHWLDSSIENFNPIEANKYCQSQILNNIDPNKKNILITHTVPNILLNSFSKEDPDGLFNSYSGNTDFLKNLIDKNFIYSFCGHTHRYEEAEIYGIKCYNIGNDYFWKTGKIKKLDFII